MKTFTNINATDFREAAARSQKERQSGRAVSFAGGGSDLQALVKDRIVRPDVILNLKTVKGMDHVATARGGGLSIGGLATLDSISHHERIRRDYLVLAEAAENVATPQVRNVGTVAGNVCQRPWCWYYRNGFACYKAGGNTCFSITGENRFHAIFGGGPSFIVHPSDTAPALVALNATFRLVSPTGERKVQAGDFFALPKVDPSRENILGADELLAGIELPAVRPGTRSSYHKVFDREAWTHAVASVAVVLEIDKDTCRAASIVLGGVAPIPWRVKEAERLLAGQRITPDLATRVGVAAVAGAQPLGKNKYKIGLTEALVQRAILALGSQV